MKFVLKYLKPYYGTMSVGLFIKFIGTIMDLLIPYILAYIIDEVTPTKEFSRVLFWGIVMLVCSALALIGNVVANRMAAAVARDTTQSVRNDLFAKIFSLSNNQIHKFSIPSLISRMTTDTYYIHRTVGMVQRIGIRAPILLLGGIIMTLLLDPMLCLVLCSMMPILGIIVTVVSKKGLPLFDKLQTETDKLVRVVRENATGVRVIKALSRTQAEKERFSEVNRRVMTAENRAAKTMAVTRPANNLVLNIGLVLVVVVGAYRVNAGLSETGAIIAFLTYFTIILNAMIMITRVITMYSQMLASSNRIKEVMEDVEPSVALPPEKELSDSAIEFRDVSYSYNKNKYQLKHISFSVKKGQSLGILGSTGSGKTTICSLLLRLYDIDSGEVLVDGKDVRLFDVSELRRKFGVVYQNDAVFAGTAESNIKLWRDIPLEDIDTALTVAQADFLKKEGLSKEIAAHGANISGGQKQRLLIARALAGRPEILILDDSSSALDYKTDARLRAGIAEHFGDTTTVIVAQRVSSVRNCDKILVLEKGSVVGFGSHKELMASCPVYAEIAKIQMGEGEE